MDERHSKVEIESNNNMLVVINFLKSSIFEAHDSFSAIGRSVNEKYQCFCSKKFNQCLYWT